MWLLLVAVGTCPDWMGWSDCRLFALMMMPSSPPSWTSTNHHHPLTLPLPLPLPLPLTPQTLPPPLSLVLLFLPVQSLVVISIHSRQPPLPQWMMSVLCHRCWALCVMAWQCQGYQNQTASSGIDRFINFMESQCTGSHNYSIITLNLESNLRDIVQLYCIL